MRGELPAGSGAQGDEVLPGAFLNVTRQSEPGLQAADSVDQPGRCVVGILWTRAAAENLASALVCKPIDGLNDRDRVDDKQISVPGDDGLNVALAGVASTVRQPFGQVAEPLDFPLPFFLAFRSVIRASTLGPRSSLTDIVASTGSSQIQQRQLSCSPMSSNLAMASEGMRSRCAWHNVAD